MASWQVGDQVRLGHKGVLVWTVVKVAVDGQLHVEHVSDAGRRFRYAKSTEVVRHSPIVYDFSHEPVWSKAVGWHAPHGSEGC